MRIPVPLTLCVVMAVTAFPAGAATSPGTTTPIERTRSELNLYLELHSQLLLAASSSESAMPEYRSEVLAYKAAREMTKDPAVWRLVTDACVTGPDIQAIARAGERLPPTLAPADREAVNKAIDALVSAWPRFEAKDLDEHRRSLQTILVRVIRKGFEGLHGPRLIGALYDRMQFKPVDASITIYPVVAAAEAGVWGKTPGGYYLVIPTGKLPQLIVIENIVHELTHLIDANQPPAWKDILVRLREKSAGADPANLDEFLHGLVSWNAGEMIKRFVNAEHRTFADLSPQRRAKYERFLPAYQETWAPYFDGKITAEQAIDRLAAAAKTAPPAPAPAPAAAPGS